jgi:acetyl esterase/lipase
MDLSPIAVAKILLPKTPMILKTALFNTLSLSENASKQDLRTEVTVAIIRSMLSRRVPLGKAQRFGLKDQGIKGPMWIAKLDLPAPEDAEGPRDALVRAIQELGDGRETYSLPEITKVEGEWTGYRSGADKNAQDLQVPEEEKYARMMGEVKSKVTILYFHGGAYCVMDPSSHRPVTSHLAKLIQGRCFSVRYRLAPQNPFPAAILDALVAYLSLLSPPPGAFHEAVQPNDIVFAGDSAGGNLALVLLQIILTLRRVGLTKISFHGKDVPLDIPAGVSGQSPWCDIARTLPSVYRNAHFDYLDPPSQTGLPLHPPDDIWPTKPPRVEIYTEASTLVHPLVSPLAAGSDLWRGAPPVYLCVGNEGLEDEIAVVARRLHNAGVTVVFDGYEGMPHCFAMIFRESIASKHCFTSWANFCMEAVEGRVLKKETGTWMKAFTDPASFDEVKLGEITAVTDAVVDQRLLEARNKAMKLESDMQETWREQQAKSRL